MLGKTKKISNRRNRKRIWCISASIFVILVIYILALVKTNNVNLDSRSLTVFSARERFGSVPLSAVQNPATPSNIKLNHIGEDFSYRSKIYKSALIITWDQPVDSVFLESFPKKGNRFFYSRVKSKMGRVIVVPLNSFDASEYPVTVKLRFWDTGHVFSDSLIVNSRY